ncbi:MAG: hypothetical protein QXT73_00690 [Candidatus Methanomethylicaceae archaeon]
MARTIRKLSTKVLRIIVTEDASASVSIEILAETKFNGVHRTQVYTEIGVFVGRNPLYCPLSVQTENGHFQR